MLSILDIRVKEEVVRNTCRISCSMFLLMHALYLLLFLFRHVYFMVYYNIGSILFYVLLLILINKSLKVFAIASFYEILVFCSASIICVGWGFGFELLLIGIVILVFYSGYMAKKLDNFNIHPTVMSIECMIVFFIVGIISLYVDPVYKNVSAHMMHLNMIHGIIVFGFEIVFGFILTTSALRLEDEIYKNSITDPLTQVDNRQGIETYYSKIDEKAREGYIISIYDIDNFKQINDTYGHKFGDNVLKGVAKTIVESLPDDAVCRWGGEEFVTITKITGDEGEETAKLDNVRKAIEMKRFVYKKQTTVSVTITIGAKRYLDYTSLANWVSAADKNLYEGKKSGKNKLIIS